MNLDDIDLADIELAEPVAPRNKGGRPFGTMKPFTRSPDVTGGFDNDPLGTQTQPRALLVHEKPEHRLVAALKAQGYAHTEIAALTGYSKVHIGTIVNQPDTRRMIFQEISKRGGDSLAALMSSDVPQAWENIVELANKAESEPVKLSANKHILDRVLGQTVARTQTDARPLHDLEATEREIARTEAAIKQITGVVVLPANASAQHAAPIPTGP